jgi:hypothetical protein
MLRSHIWGGMHKTTLPRQKLLAERRARELLSVMERGKAGRNCGQRGHNSECQSALVETALAQFLAIFPESDKTSVWFSASLMQFPRA